MGPNPAGFESFSSHCACLLFHSGITPSLFSWHLNPQSDVSDHSLTEREAEQEEVAFSGARLLN